MVLRVNRVTNSALRTVLAFSKINNRRYQFLATDDPTWHLTTNAKIRKPEVSRFRMVQLLTLVRADTIYYVSPLPFEALADSFPPTALKDRGAGFENCLLSAIVTSCGRVTTILLSCPKRKLSLTILSMYFLILYGSGWFCWIFRKSQVIAYGPKLCRSIS